MLTVAFCFAFVSCGAVREDDGSAGAPTDPAPGDTAPATEAAAPARDEPEDEIDPESFLKSLPESFGEIAVRDDLVIQTDYWALRNGQLWGDFEASVAKGEPASVATARPTIEGDPIIYFISFDGERFTCYTDTTRDKFGAGGGISSVTARYLCRATSPVDADVTVYVLSDEKDVYFDDVNQRYTIVLSAYRSDLPDVSSEDIRNMFPLEYDDRTPYVSVNPGGELYDPDGEWVKFRDSVSNGEPASVMTKVSTDEGDVTFHKVIYDGEIFEWYEYSSVLHASDHGYVDTGEDSCAKSGTARYLIVEYRTDYGDGILAFCALDDVPPESFRPEMDRYLHVISYFTDHAESD